MNKAQQTILWQDLKTAREKLAACASIQAKIHDIVTQDSDMHAHEVVELSDLWRELEVAQNDLFMTLNASKLLDRVTI